jgi:NDP-sugar pyrophosphorylase family protein
MKAMIFAAGLGKRLGNITKDVPKALVDINGKSILRRTVEKVSAHGFDDIIVNVHHHASLVEKEIALLVREGYHISVSDERDLLLETGGGLFKARWFFDDKPFLMFNADIITDLDPGKLLALHNEKKGIATLAVADHGHNRVFITDDGGLIHGWRNRSAGEEIMAREPKMVMTEISFSGIHIADPLIFSFMTEGVYSMTALYLQLASSHNIWTYRHDKDFWIDIGTPDQLEMARKRLDKLT